MADNKKYYYLKLKEGFFDSEDMKLLQAMKDGYMYSDILLKLYLKSLRQNGRLMYRDIIPYTPDMIATVTNHQIGTVEKALEIFKQMGFIEILDNGAIYMLDIQSFIGQGSSEADRKRTYRNVIDAEKLSLLEDNNRTNERQMSEECPPNNGTNGGQMFKKCPSNGGTNGGQMSKKCPPNGGTNGGQMSEKCPPENRDKRIENKDKKNIINNILAPSSDKQSLKLEVEADVEALILNDGTEWKPSAALVAEYVRLYPNVDVKQQFNEMRGWCIANPQKRKTKRGITKFVNNWLCKAQDKGYRKTPTCNNYPQSSPSAEKESYSPDVFERLINESRADVFEQKGE